MQVFVYTFHKSGSMFLHRYFKGLAGLSGCTHFSVNNRPPDQNAWKKCSGSFIVAPVRIMPGSLENPGGSKSVLHLRDPIDVLISQYYSWGWSHAMQPSETFLTRRLAIQQQTLDEYCLSECGELAGRYRLAMAACHDFPGVIPSDYASMMDDFRSWNRYICRAVLGAENKQIEAAQQRAFRSEFGLLRKLFQRPVSPADITSGKAQPHRRDGGHNQKSRYLRPDTIRRLEQEMRDVLAFFSGFQASSKAAIRAAG